MWDPSRTAYTAMRSDGSGCGNDVSFDMYFLLLAIGFCAAYIALHYLFGQLLSNKTVALTRDSARSIAYILLFHSMAQIGVWCIPDLEWSNRFQHAIGGGFLAFFICFRVAHDTHIPIRRLQFFVWGFLVVTTLGVANELVEFFLQTVTSLVFTTRLEDTWLDLLSNSVGTLVAAAVFVPMLTQSLPKRNRKR